MIKNITDDLGTPIGYDENYVHKDVKKSFYKISKVPTGKKQKMRWIFNPSYYMRPFQQASLQMLYTFNTMMHPSIAGCIPGARLPEKVKGMYDAESIYITDIKSFFKTLNRTVLYKATDRMLYKYIATVADGLVKNEARAHDLNSLKYFKREEELTYSNSAILMPEMLEKAQKPIYTENMESRFHNKGRIPRKTRSLNGYIAQLLASDSDRRAILLKENADISKVLSKPFAHLAVTHLLYIVLGRLAAADSLSHKVWDRSADREPEILKAIRTHNVFECLNKAFLTSNNKYAENAVMRNAGTKGASLMLSSTLLTGTCSNADELELLRRIMFFLVDANTTHMNSLPEGAATSPMLANLVLDSIASDVMEKFRHTPDHMVLYMDDMSMGYSKKMDDKMVTEINQDFDSILNSYGIKRHLIKTKVFKTKQRREILGVNVTEYKGPTAKVDIRVSRQYRRTIRATIFNLQKFLEGYSKFLDTGKGITPSAEFVEKHYPKGYTAKSHFSIKKRMKEINGKLSWMQNVSKAQAKPFVTKISTLKAKHFPILQEQVFKRSLGLIDLRLVPGK